MPSRTRRSSIDAGPIPSSLFEKVNRLGHVTDLKEPNRWWGVILSSAEDEDLPSDTPDEELHIKPIPEDLEGLLAEKDRGKYVGLLTQGQFDRLVEWYRMSASCNGGNAMGVPCPGGAWYSIFPSVIFDDGGATSTEVWATPFPRVRRRAMRRRDWVRIAKAVRSKYH
jgi:hypothetical protein